MTTPRRDLRVQVRIGDAVWRDEVERFDPGSAAHVTAERERRRLERDGAPLTELGTCAPHGPDGTRLAGL